MHEDAFCGLIPPRARTGVAVAAAMFARPANPKVGRLSAGFDMGVNTGATRR